MLWCLNEFQRESMGLFRNLHPRSLQSRSEVLAKVEQKWNRRKNLLACNHLWIVASGSIYCERKYKYNTKIFSYFCLAVDIESILANDGHKAVKQLLQWNAHKITLPFIVYRNHYFHSATQLKGCRFTILLYWHKHKNAAQSLAKSLMGTQLLSPFPPRPLPDEQITRPMSGDWTWRWLWHRRVQIWLRQAVGRNYNTTSLSPSSYFLGWLFSHPEKSGVWMAAVSSVASYSSFPFSSSFSTSMSQHLRQVCWKQLHTNSNSRHGLSY